MTWALRTVIYLEMITLHILEDDMPWVSFAGSLSQAMGKASRGYLRKPTENCEFILYSSFPGPILCSHGRHCIRGKDPY